MMNFFRAFDDTASISASLEALQGRADKVAEAAQVRKDAAARSIDNLTVRYLEHSEEQGRALAIRARIGAILGA